MLTDNELARIKADTQKAIDYDRRWPEQIHIQVRGDVVLALVAEVQAARQAK